MIGWLTSSLLGERHLLVDAVDRGGGAEDEICRSVSARRFEQAERPDAVDVLVEHRLSETGTDAGAGGQVDDGVEAAVGEEPVHQRLVADVPLDQAPVVPPGELRDVGALARGVVEVVEVVEHRHPIAPRQEPPGEVRADEAGAAGDEDVLTHTRCGRAYRSSDPARPDHCCVGGVGAAGASASSSPSRRTSMPFFWRLRISRRRIADSSMPMTMSFIAW